MIDNSKIRLKKKGKGKKRKKKEIYSLTKQNHDMEKERKEVQNNFYEALPLR